MTTTASSGRCAETALTSSRKIARKPKTWKRTARSRNFFITKRAACEQSMTSINLDVVTFALELFIVLLRFPIKVYESLVTNNVALALSQQVQS